MNDTKLTFVLMAGLPGSGKSTLADRLGDELGWRVIKKDELKDNLLNQGWNSDSASEEAYKQSFAEAVSILAEQQVSVIFDSAALHSFVVKKAQDIINELKKAQIEVQLKVILCVTSRDQRNERVLNRPFPISSIRVNPATEADYLQYFKHLPPDRREIKTDNPIEECLSVARDYLTS